MDKPAFCAHCVEERSDLKRCVRKGRTVWLCADCQDPVGALRQHDVVDRDERGAVCVATSRDGGRRTGTGKWR